MKLALVTMATAVGGCSGGGMKSVTSEDHYSERGAIGNMQVRTEVAGDTVKVTFAPVPAAWKDPRTNKVENTPAWIAKAGCTLTATKADKQYTVTPGQTCRLEDRTLTVERGFVWLRDDVLNVDLNGTFDRGGEYALQYPYGVVEPALKVH